MPITGFDTCAKQYYKGRYIHIFLSSSLRRRQRSKPVSGNIELKAVYSDIESVHMYKETGQTEDEEVLGKYINAH